MADSPEIFDRALRAQRRDRAAGQFPAHDFLYRHMLDELLDRLSDVQRDLPEALVIGCPDDHAARRLEVMGKRVICADPGFRNARSGRGVQVDEDMLPFADASFDLVLACGTLDSVNDLPGALVLINRILRPDGLFLAAFTGAGSLSALRAALFSAEGNRPGQHIHPQIDTRAGGDLLSRTGFVMPVADGDTLTVRYGSMLTLISDLRGMGAGIALTSRPPRLTRAQIGATLHHFSSAADPDGKTAERFSIVYLSGWKSDPSQAAPARRGSATTSLAQALKSKSS